MNTKIATAIGAAALSLTMCATASFAGTLLEPGETVGIATGAPLPEGVFFVDTAAYSPDSRGTPHGLFVNVPIIAWSTPFSFYNTRLILLAAAPEVAPTRIPPAAGITNRLYIYNPAAVAELAHDFGNGFGAAYFAGVRPGVNEAPAFTTTSFEQRFAVSYTGNGYDLTAILENGIFNTRISPDYLILDVTATKKFDKIEFGFVATASTDVGTLPFGYNAGVRQKQLALGGLLGYDFGKFTLQAIGLADVAEHGYVRREARGFLRVIAPLYVAPTAPAPVIARY